MTSSTQTDATILQSGYDAFAAGDVASVLAICADDVVWHVPGNNPLAGDWVGQQGIVDFCTTIVELSGGTFTVEADEMFDNGTGTVVVLSTAGAERNGTPSVWPVVQVWQFEGGLVTSMRDYFAQQDAIDAFWS